MKQISPLKLITSLLGSLHLAWANVHPITIHGHYFVNSVTKEPVRVKKQTVEAISGVYTNKLF